MTANTGVKLSGESRAGGSTARFSRAGRDDPNQNRSSHRTIKLLNLYFTTTYMIDRSLFPFLVRDLLQVDRRQ